MIWVHIVCNIGYNCTSVPKNMSRRGEQTTKVVPGGLPVLCVLAGLATG